MNTKRRPNNERNYINQNIKPYYNYTSEAYDYDTFTYPQVKPRENKIYKKKIKYIKTEKNVNWLSLKFVFALTTIFTFSVLSLSLQGKITQAQSTVTSLNKELKEIYEDNNYISIELAKNLDLTEVEQLAINRAGMQYPTESQIVYINIPKESYTVKNDDITTETNDNFLTKLLSKLNFLQSWLPN